MGGGLIQLVAYGAQDVYLTGNPQITFFKIVYRRHTNFSMESIEQSYNGNVDFGSKFTVNITRSGDLVGPMTLEVDVGLNLEGLYGDSDAIGDYKWSAKTADFHGWLLCDGRLLDKRQYSRLFAKIGYSFGGSGNQFRLPDMRGKVIAATDAGSNSSHGIRGNVWEQIVLSGSTVSIANDTITVAQNDDKWKTGMLFQFENAAPVGLSTLIPYYIIRINSTTIKVATSLANAVQYTTTNNTLAVNIIGTGSGTSTIRHFLYPRSMGETAGAETHGLTIAEMPSHNHGVATRDQDASNNRTSEYTHDHTGNTGTAGLHNHGGETEQSDYSGSTTVISSAAAITSSTEVADNRDSHNHAIAWDGSHNHTIPSDTHYHTMNPAGDNTAHSVMQPTVFAGSLFIYAGVISSVTKAEERLKDHLIRWGFQLIDNVEIEIGGQLIDRHYGEWLDIWTQLTYTQEKYQQLLSMINTSLHSSIQDSGYDKTAKLYIPLQFWFNRNPGLYLPLIALQYHEVKLNIEFNTKAKVNTATQRTSNVVSIDGFNYDTGAYTKTNYIESILQCRVFADYVFLDTDERRRFAQVSHEYLIEQVQSGQTIGDSASFVNIPLYFNHPCKAIIWRAQKNNPTAQDISTGGASAYNNKFFLGQLYDYTAIGGNTTEEHAEHRLNSDVVKRAKIEINGMDRALERDGTYYRVVQPNMFIGSTNSALSHYHDSHKLYGGHFYMYNFGLRMDEHQPSGTCNFSRIDNAILHLTVNPYASSESSPVQHHDYEYRVFAVNYNVLRIMSGMGGLAYSN
jgi:microcystin-dependent protein